MPGRPQVLKITKRDIHRKPSKRSPVPTIMPAYECEHLDDMLREFLYGDGEQQVSTVALWECEDDSCTIPAGVFKLFDWVICQHIPQDYWDVGSVVHTWKHDSLPDVQAKRKTVTFFAGFEKRTFKKHQPAPRKSSIPPTLSPIPECSPLLPGPTPLIDLSSSVDSVFESSWAESECSSTVSCASDYSYSEFDATTFGSLSDLADVHCNSGYQLMDPVWSIPPSEDWIEQIGMDKPLSRLMCALPPPSPCSEDDM